MKTLEKKKTMTVIAAALAAMLGLGLAADASAQARAARPAQAQVEADVGATRGDAEGVVNVNTASADELMRLPGIGPSKAAAILALRGRMAGQRFGRVEDLLRVRGIGRATLRKLRALVALSGSTTLVEHSRTTSRRAAGAGTDDAAESGDDASE